MLPRLASRRWPSILPSRRALTATWAKGAPPHTRRAIHSSSLGYDAPFNVSLAQNPHGLDIVFEGDSLPGDLPGAAVTGTRKAMSIPEFWLRDNCRCSSCVNGDTKQRNFDTFKVDSDVRAVEISEQGDKLDVKWSDGHSSVHSWSWLLSVVSPQPTNISRSWTSNKKPWGADMSDGPLPDIPYSAIMRDDGRPAMADLMQALCEYGLAFVTGTPASPDATEKLLEKIGPVRNTHYGGFYDFIPDLASADTAYTNLALAPHTDTTYFSDPAGLQSFHMLSHHAPPGRSADDEGLGGQSLLVDGLRVALEMRDKTPELFDVLKGHAIPWHASGNDDASITPDRRYPVIETLGSGPNAPIHRIRWNNDDRGVVPPAVAPLWYEAARKWNSLIKDPAFQFWFQLEPGRVLIFDNWRVMHGRSAFEGVRRICGAYINRDDFFSQWKLSCHSREDVECHNLSQRDS